MKFQSLLQTSQVALNEKLHHKSNGLDERMTWGGTAIAGFSESCVLLEPNKKLKKELKKLVNSEGCADVASQDGQLAYADMRSIHSLVRRDDVTVHSAYSDRNEVVHIRKVSRIEKRKLHRVVLVVHV